MDQAAVTVQFAVRGRFTAAIGAIDRRLVAIKVPSQREWMFSITVRFHAINVQMLCDERSNGPTSRLLGRPRASRFLARCCLLLRAPSEHPHTSGWDVLHPEDLVLVPTAAVCQPGAQEVSDSVLLVSFSWLRSSPSDQPFKQFSTHHHHHHQPVFKLSSRIPQSPIRPLEKKKDHKGQRRHCGWFSFCGPQWTQLTTAFFCGDSRRISASTSRSSRSFQCVVLHN